MGSHHVAYFGHKWICLQRGPGFDYDGDVEKNEECGDNVQPVYYNSCNHNLLEQAWTDACMGIDMDCPQASPINIELTDDHSIFDTPSHGSFELDSNSTNPVPTNYSEHVVASPSPDHDAESDPLHCVVYVLCKVYY